MEPFQILNEVTGNIDAKKACTGAMKLHKKYLKKVRVSYINPLIWCYIRVNIILWYFCLDKSISLSETAWCHPVLNLGVLVLLPPKGELLIQEGNMYPLELFMLEDPFKNGVHNCLRLI